MTQDTNSAAEYFERLKRKAPEYLTRHKHSSGEVVELSHVGCNLAV
jgi:hypothetical protein